MKVTKESMLVTARRYADQELLGKATASQVTWLHEHPILWHRALRQAYREVSNHIAKSAADVAMTKNEDAARGMPSPEYIQARAEHAKWTQRRLHVKNKLKRRLTDVRALCGASAVSMNIVGDLVLAFADIQYAIDQGEPAKARELAVEWIRQLTEPGEVHPEDGDHREE